MRLTIFILAFLTFVHPANSFSQTREDHRFLWRISLENPKGHIQYKVVKRFADRFEELAAGQVKVEIFDEARLYRDVDLPRALSSDRIEMGVPGIWQLDRLVPDFGVFLLPLFYGRSPAINYAVVDGPVGQALDGALSNRLGVVVPGRWIDLGPAHIFTFNRPIRRAEDFAGLRLRVAGGVANEMRLQRFGAVPARVAWPDLPEAIDRNGLDGLLTSYVTIENAPFAARVRYAYEDSAYFPQYVPIVGAGAWRRLGPDLRALLSQAWEEGVNAARTEAEKAQADARSRLAARGLKVVRPTADEISANRNALIEVQDDIIEAARITPSLVGGLQYRFQSVEIDP